jgi:hypothetical protein
MMSKDERRLTAELLEQIRHDFQTQTQFAAQLAGQAINDTLEVFTGVFDATGQFTREYGVAAGSIEVSNWGVAANFITVTSGAAAGSAPVGTGSYVVAGGQSRTIALASRVFTLYGTAGDKFSVQVFTAGVRPTTQ